MESLAFFAGTHFWRDAQLVISIIVLVPSFWVILSDKFSPAQKHWAYGVVGMVLGFWLGHRHGQHLQNSKVAY
jgi:hypothetical protein